MLPSLCLFVLDLAIRCCSHVNRMSPSFTCLQVALRTNGGQGPERVQSLSGMLHLMLLAMLPHLFLVRVANVSLTGRGALAIAVMIAVMTSAARLPRHAVAAAGRCKGALNHAFKVMA